MFADCDARDELVSHEMSAIQGVVAKWHLSGSQGDEIGTDGNRVLVSSARPVTSSSEKRTNTPFHIHKPQYQYAQHQPRIYLSSATTIFTNYLA